MSESNLSELKQKPAQLIADVAVLDVFSKANYSSGFVPERFHDLFSKSTSRNINLAFRKIPLTNPSKVNPVIEIGWSDAKNAFVHKYANGEVKSVAGDFLKIPIKCLNVRDPISFFNSMETFLKNVKQEVQDNPNKLSVDEMKLYKSDAFSGMREIIGALRPELDALNTHAHLTKLLRQINHAPDANYQIHHDIRREIICTLTNQYPQFADPLLCVLNSESNLIKVNHPGHIIIHECIGEPLANVLAPAYFADAESKPVYRKITKFNRDKKLFLPVSYLKGSESKKAVQDAIWQNERKNKAVYLFFGEMEGIPVCDFYSANNDTDFKDKIKDPAFRDALNSTVPGSLKNYKIRQSPILGTKRI